MEDWQSCKRILIIRADNMGDVIMSLPAIRAVRKYTGARITLLTSGKGAAIAALSKDIDEVLKFDLPWVKQDEADGPEQLNGLISLLKNHQFDGCIIFTVYSQNPAPAALITYMAGIPLRLAYCRENPYDLLTHWVPDPEPLDFIRHQTQRDLALVATIGATETDTDMLLEVPPNTVQHAAGKLQTTGLDMHSPFIVLHAGVSEKKRQYPIERWIKCGKKLAQLNMPVLLTGSAEEIPMLKTLKTAIGDHAHITGAALKTDEFAAVIANAAVVVTVNTGTLHLASVFKTPVVALYAQTNPQHKPWLAPNVVLEYSIPAELKSKNKIIKHVDKRLYNTYAELPDEDSILSAVMHLLNRK